MAPKNRQHDGLSELQKTILMMAFRNRVAEERTAESAGADVLYHEVRTHLMAGRTDQARYEALAATVSRAFKRLEGRGLMRRIEAATYWPGATLTERGAEIAAELCKKSPPPASR